MLTKYKNINRILLQMVYLIKEKKGEFIYDTRFPGLKLTIKNNELLFENGNYPTYLNFIINNVKYYIQTDGIITAETTHNKYSKTVQPLPKFEFEYYSEEKTDQEINKIANNLLNDLLQLDLKIKKTTDEIIRKSTHKPYQIK